jgi:hypothetical protein
MYNILVSPLCRNISLKNVKGGLASCAKRNGDVAFV